MFRDTIPIVFHAGTYGTYLEWALTTLTTDVDVVRPFKGSTSHAYKGTHLINFTPGWANYLQSQMPKKFVRLHPRTKENECNNEIVSKLLETVDNVIYITPADKDTMLCVNNHYYKIRKNWWEYEFVNNQIDPTVIYNNWPVDPTVPISQVPNWIVREFLSLYLPPKWYSMISWRPDPRCVQINIKQDLFYNFEHTINKIASQCQLKLTKPISSILGLHSEMISLQKYCGQDDICNQIIESVTNHLPFDWYKHPLTILSEAWIQWRLRNLGYEIRCHGIDLFPTNSVQLQELLYKT